MSTEPSSLLARVDAPWTDEQVRDLNEFQACGYVHPFTCDGDHPDRTLVATPEGWKCRHCDYRQPWAWSFMTQGAPPISKGVVGLLPTRVNP